MKKIFAIFLTVSFLLTLSSCDAGASNGTDARQGRGGDSILLQADGDVAPTPDSQQQQEGTQQSPRLTAEEALNIALTQAGVARESIRDLESKLDREDGALVWEIDFDAGDTEYSYSVNAETGAVVERERDRSD